MGGVIMWGGGDYYNIFCKFVLIIYKQICEALQQVTCIVACAICVSVLVWLNGSPVVADRIKVQDVSLSCPPPATHRHHGFVVNVVSAHAWHTLPRAPVRSNTLAARLLQSWPPPRTDTCKHTYLYIDIYIYIYSIYIYICSLYIYIYTYVYMYWV